MRIASASLSLYLCTVVAPVPLRAAAGGLAIGSPAPEIVVHLQSGRTSLRDFVRETPAAILQWSGLKSADSCSVIASAARALAGENVRLILASDAPVSCSRMPNLYRVEESGTTLRDQFAIVDTFGVVRVLLPLAKASDVDAASKLGARWETGRQSFSTHCGHCHGDDGDDRAYPNIKTLKRITARMSEELVLDGGQQFGAVDISSWTPEIKETILLYIRGL